MTIFVFRIFTIRKSMKVINLGETNSVLNSFIAQMRDKRSEVFDRKDRRAVDIYIYS